MLAGVGLGEIADQTEADLDGVAVHVGVDVCLGLFERGVSLLGVLGAADGAAAGAIGLGDLRPLVGGIVGALELVVIGVKLGELGLAVGLEERLEGLLLSQGRKFVAAHLADVFVDAENARCVFIVRDR